jgi:hypothetical protein
LSEVSILLNNLQTKEERYEKKVRDLPFTFIVQTPKGTAKATVGGLEEAYIS